MRRQLILSLALVIVLLSAGGYIMRKLILTKPTPPPADTLRGPLVVRGVRLEPRSVVESHTGFGTARADRQAWVAAEVVGRIVELADDLRAGAAVSEGQTLLKIDDREYDATLNRARSQLAAAKSALKQIDVEQSNLARLVKIAEEEYAVTERELTRVRDLLEQGQSSPREADQTRLAFERARRTLQTVVNQQALLPEQRSGQEAMCELHRAEVAIAQLNLERCTIEAPFDGRLDDVRVELGERVGPGQQLLSIVDPVRIEVPIELPVSLHGRVRVEGAARLSLESNPGVVWTGQVARIAPSASELTRTFALFVDVDNSAQADPLIPGMFVHARIEGPTLDGALLVPRGSIQDACVFVCRDGRAFRQEVRVERHLADQVAIDGIEPGTVVITTNLDALYDGAAVEVLLERPTAAGAASPQEQPSVKTP